MSDDQNILQKDAVKIESKNRSTCVNVKKQHEESGFTNI